MGATRWGVDTYTPSQMASIHLCSGVVFVTLIARFHLNEPLGSRQLLGFALMAVSFVLVMYRGDAAPVG